MASVLWPNPNALSLAYPTTRVNDANYQASASDTVIGFATLTASRNVTLPPSASVPIGKPIVVKDLNGNVTALKTITVLPSGTDTIDNGLGPATLMCAYDAVELVLAAPGVWAWVTRPRQIGTWNGIATNPVSLPNNVWTYIPLGTELISDGTQLVAHSLITSSATMVSTGALPLASIVLNAIPGDWPSAGLVAITGPNVAGHDTVVRYTGTSGGTTLTGCTGGVGTLAAGQTVKQANAISTIPINCLFNIDGIVTFPSTAAGILGVRFFGPPGSLFAGGTQTTGFQGAQSTLSISTSFLQTVATGPFQICLQAFQTSGATIELPIDAIEAPLLGGAYASSM